MNDVSELSVVARKARAGAEERRKAQVTPDRAMRLALARSSEKATGLRLTVTEVTEHLCHLDDMLSHLGRDDLFVGIERDRTLIGLVALDSDMRGALVEIQTVGSLATRPADSRPATSTDAALIVPTIDGVMADLAVNAPEPLCRWTAGATCGRKLDGLHAASMSLAEAKYRLVQLSVDLGAGGRSGKVALALPDEVRAPQPADDQPEDEVNAGWEAQLATVVLGAPANLNAVLHRMKMPLNAIENLRVDEVLPLNGVTVNSVRMEGADRRPVARARLGTVAGLRAIRLEEPPAPQLSQMPTGLRGPGRHLALSEERATDLVRAAGLEKSDAADDSGSDATGAPQLDIEAEPDPQTGDAPSGEGDEGFAIGFDSDPSIELDPEGEEA